MSATRCKKKEKKSFPGNAAASNKHWGQPFKGEAAPLLTNWGCWASSSSHQSSVPSRDIFLAVKVPLAREHSRVLSRLCLRFNSELRLLHRHTQQTVNIVFSFKFQSLLWTGKEVSDHSYFKTLRYFWQHVFLACWSSSNKWEKS